MPHGFGIFRVPVTIIRCVHHLSDADGVEHIRQNRFFRLTGKADLGISHQRFVFSISYRQRCGPMSPKCLHDGNHESLTSPGSQQTATKTGQVFPNVEVLGMETSWRHQFASSLNNEGIFSAQDYSSCELGQKLRTSPMTLTSEQPLMELGWVGDSRVMTPFSIKSFASASTLRKAGDNKFFQRDRSFIWFCHCASLLDHLIRPHQHVWRNC